MRVQPAGGDEPLDGELDEAAVHPGMPGDVGHGGRAGPHLVQHQAGQAHETSLPTWNTATASTHAVVTLMPMLATIHRPPTSRRSAASVATHGV